MKRPKTVIRKYTRKARQLKESKAFTALEKMKIKNWSLFEQILLGVNPIVTGPFPNHEKETRA